MGWLILLGMVAVLFGALLWLGKIERKVIELVGAALLLGVAGYAWQGHPGLAGTPVEAVQKPDVFDESTIASRGKMGERFGSASEWLVFADALNRAGQHAAAANYLRNGTREHGENPDLWVGLGNALVVHAEGIITPAAEFAFQKAAQISPEHPGPPFFMGLALAQTGKVDDARIIWRELLDRSPADAPWRADLEARLAQIGQAMPPVSSAEAQK